MRMLSPEFWLQTTIYILGGFAAVVAVAFRIGQMEKSFATKEALQQKADEHAKFATKEELREKVSERNGKIDRVYERFDAHKRECNENLVRKDVCCQLHMASKDEIKRLDDEYKSFRHEIRNTVQQIFDKIDELRALILEKK